MILYEDFIFTDKLETLKFRINKLNKRATKLGFDYILVETFESHVVHEFQLTKILVKGPVPVLQGWFLIAVKDFQRGIGLIIKEVPGQVLPEKYKETETSCEHCKTNRNRSKTYVLQNINGTIIEVGSSCLSDFLNVSKVDNIIEQARNLDIITEIIRDARDSRGCDIVYDLRTFIACSIEAIRREGFIGTSKAEKTGKCPTYITAIEIMFGSSNSKSYIPTNKDLTEADKIISYFINLIPSNNYEYNLTQIAKAGIVTKTVVAYAASMIPTYRKLSIPKEGKVSEYVGEVKSKIEVALFLKREIVIDGVYGVTTYYIFEDELQNEFVWNTSSPVEINKETLVVVKGTIKQHKEYNGVKQTILTRCKIKN